LDKLLKAYPDAIVGYSGQKLEMKNGALLSVGPLHDTYAERLKNSSILDQMSLRYPKGPGHKPDSVEDDPGRFRNIAFFDLMYGNCEKHEVEKNLVSTRWMPNTSNQTLRVTSINGVAKHLRAVSDELDALPETLRRFATPSAGTFNCRRVADTGNRSMHAWGAAIDLNTKFSDYWVWRKGQPYRNRIPIEIVLIFEKHGFVWGGKWGHYDTMHFEYRPELLLD
jgi:hypothetical protein